MQLSVGFWCGVGPHTDSTVLSMGVVRMMTMLVPVVLDRFDDRDLAEGTSST